MDEAAEAVGQLGSESLVDHGSRPGVTPSHLLSNRSDVPDAGGFSRTAATSTSEASFAS